MEQKITNYLSGLQDVIRLYLVHLHLPNLDTVRAQAMQAEAQQLDEKW